MPRYQFQCSYGGAAVVAEDRELGNVEDARLDAIVYAAELLSSRPEVAWTGHKLDIRVLDDAGGAVITIEITATVTAPFSDGKPTTRPEQVDRSSALGPTTDQTASPSPTAAGFVVG